MQTAPRKRKPTAPPMSPPAAITEDAIRGYLAVLSSKGRTRDTIHMYSTRLRSLWEFLPQEKLVYPKTLGEWQASLLQHGYSAETVNIYLSAANGLLDYIGRRDLQLMTRLKAVRGVPPELTRREYLRLLQTAKALERERTYLLIKTFALTGIQTVDLSKVTAEAVKAGRFLLTFEGEQRSVVIPRCLQQELTDYIGRKGISSGPVFLTRNGNAIQRTQVTAEIQAMSRDARVEEAKCKPRCLRKLYMVTQAEIERTVRVLAMQSYEQLLETEQFTIGWSEA